MRRWTDEEVLKLAGVAVGEPLSAAAEKAIEQRLKDSQAVRDGGGPQAVSLARRSHRRRARPGGARAAGRQSRPPASCGTRRRRGAGSPAG